MRTLVLLAAAMMLAAVSAALAIKSLTLDAPAVPAPQPVTISIDELQRQVDARSLPEPEIKGPI